MVQQNYTEISPELQKVIIRKVKARLTKRHLEKLLKELQQEKYEGKQRYTPIRSFSEEKCIDSINLDSIRTEGHYLVFDITRQLSAGVYPISVKFSQNQQHKQNGHVYFRSSIVCECISFDEIGKYIDLVLKYTCMANHWFNDATAIPIL